MLRDKDIAGVVRALNAQIDRWFVAPTPGARGSSVEDLRAALTAADVQGEVRAFDTVEQAWRAARDRAAVDDRIVAFGSFFTVGAVLDAVSRE